MLHLLKTSKMKKLILLLFIPIFILSNPKEANESKSYDKEKDGDANEEKA